MCHDMKVTCLVLFCVSLVFSCVVSDLLFPHRYPLLFGDERKLMCTMWSTFQLNRGRYIPHNRHKDSARKVVCCPLFLVSFVFSFFVLLDGLFIATDRFGASGDLKLFFLLLGCSCWLRFCLCVAVCYVCVAFCAHSHLSRFGFCARCGVVGCVNGCVSRF